MRVLLFHKGGLGDVVFGLPLMRDLKRGWPEVDLTVLTHDAGQQLLRHAPDVDHVVSYGQMAEHWTVSRALAAVTGQDRFDLALTTTRSICAAWLVFRSGAPRRVGFGGGPERLFFTDLAPSLPVERCFAHRFQRLARAAGAAAALDPAPTLVVDTAAQARAREDLARRGWNGRSPLWAVHVGGGWPTKRWPTVQLAGFCDMAVTRGVTVILQGGPADRAHAREVLAAAAAPVLDTTDDDISQAVAKASVCSAAVGVDSGLSHATAALRVPMVFLFGPNEPASIELGPRQTMLTRELACRPCNRRGKSGCPEKHHYCMRDHTPARVLHAIEAQLGLRAA